MGLFKKLFGKQDKQEAASPPPPPPPEPEPLKINEVTPHALVTALTGEETITIIDLRQSWEYNSGHIPGAVSIPMMQLPGRLNDIAKDHKVVLQCYHGISSLDAAGYLIQNGWGADNVTSLAGGISGWVASCGWESLEKEA